MRFALCFAALAVGFALSACGAPCTPTRTFPVKVVDSKNMPVSGATVTAEQVGGSKKTEGVTGGDGRTLAVTSDVGPGPVRMTAKYEARTSNTFEANFTCDSCNCFVVPASGTLVLSDP